MDSRPVTLWWLDQVGERVPEDRDSQRAGVQWPLPDVGLGFADAQGRSRVESLGERVLGSLLDRAHLMPARLVGPLVAQEIAAIGGTDVGIWLQDYDQRTLQPLTGQGLSGRSAPIEGSWPGRAFTADARIEQQLPDGSVRMYLPMLASP